MVQHTTQVRNIQLKYYNAFNENQNLAFHNLFVALFLRRLNDKKRNKSKLYIQKLLQKEIRAWNSLE